MSTDPRRGLVFDYFGDRPCNSPLVLGRVMDRLCEGKAPTALQRIAKALAKLRKQLGR